MEQMCKHGHDSVLEPLDQKKTTLLTRLEPMFGYICFLVRNICET